MKAQAHYCMCHGEKKKSQCPAAGTSTPLLWLKYKGEEGGAKLASKRFWWTTVAGTNNLEMGSSTGKTCIVVICHFRDGRDLCTADFMKWGCLHLQRSDWWAEYVAWANVRPGCAGLCADEWGRVLSLLEDVSRLRIIPLKTGVLGFLLEKMCEPLFSSVL